MKKIERKIIALEQSHQDPPSEPEPEDLEALALWYAGQHDFTRAAEVAGISEDEALARWGEGYHALQRVVRKQQRECLDYCQQQNARLLQQRSPEPEEEQPPPELQHAPSEIKMDRRRWKQIQKSRRRRTA